jgi:3-hydroxyacyl-[acyl-carrier-protein] dehydratase
MVIDSLFKIEDLIATDVEIKARVALNKGHEIFSGHFPGQPVVPGVCMMQLIKELVEVSTKTKLNLREADNIKFLSVIDPHVNSVLNAAISLSKRESDLIVTASLFADTVTFFKLKAVLNPAATTE